MTPRQQHIHELSKTVITLASALIAALAGFLAAVGPDKLLWTWSPKVLVFAILSLFTTVTASLLSMYLLSNRLVSKPRMGPRPVFAAADVAFVGFLLAMASLATVSLGELCEYLAHCAA